MTITNGTPSVSPLAQIRALHDHLVRAETLVAANKVHPVVNMPNHYNSNDEIKGGVKLERTRHE